MDQIVAISEQLDSGNWTVGTPAINAKSTILVSLFAHMSQLCQRKTEPANAQTTSQAAILQALMNTFSDQNCL